MKRLALSLLLLISLFTSAFTKPDVYKIDAGKNSQIHNNRALMYLEDKDYFAAIEEYKIAISLNPNSQASAVFYNNLGEIYMKLGSYRYAQDCFERAINQYCLNLAYYQNLAKAYKAQRTIDAAIKKYSANGKSPLNMVMLGLLYVEKGDVKHGIIKLDEFCMQEPDLIITGAVRIYLKQIIP